MDLYSLEAISFFWEDEPATPVTLSRYRKVALRLKNILEEYGISYVVESVDGKRRIVTDRVRCDLYDYLSGAEDCSQLFKGSYLSNYIRWMEDARTYFFDKAGYKVVQYEQAGVTSPVVSVECEYKSPSTFDDEIGVDVALEKCTGARITFSYVLTKIVTGEIVATGKSSHCFTDAADGLPIAVKTSPRARHGPEKRAEEKDLMTKQ